MGFPLNEKPLICQAGSAEAFAGSSATGREHYDYSAYWTPVKVILRDLRILDRATLSVWKVGGKSSRNSRFLVLNIPFWVQNNSSKDSFKNYISFKGPFWGQKESSLLLLLVNVARPQNTNHRFRINRFLCKSGTSRIFMIYVKQLELIQVVCMARDQRFWQDRNSWGNLNVSQQMPANRCSYGDYPWIWSLSN